MKTTHTYTENNSKSWDGKVIAVEADWLEELYQNEKLEVLELLESCGFRPGRNESCAAI